MERIAGACVLYGEQIHEALAVKHRDALRLRRIAARRFLAGIGLAIMR